jgi:hypothetical protein
MIDTPEKNLNLVSLLSQAFSLLSATSSIPCSQSLLLLSPTRSTKVITMLLTHAILTSTVAGSALASFHQLQPKSFHKRQELNPDITQCGPGDTCVESCGTGFELCSDATTFLCYNPSAGDSCCEGGSSSSCQFSPLRNFRFSADKLQGHVQQIASASSTTSAAPTAKTQIPAPRRMGSVSPPHSLLRPLRLLPHLRATVLRLLHLPLRLPFRRPRSCLLLRATLLELSHSRQRVARRRLWHRLRGRRMSIMFWGVQGCCTACWS